MACEKALVWPCANKGSEAYYGIDFAKYLNRESSVLDNVSWTLPNGLTNLGESITGSVAHIKIGADYKGRHVVKFLVNTVSGSTFQKLPDQVILEVE